MLLACLFALPAAATVYQCTDTDGEVIYQKEPCTGPGRELPSPDDTLTTFTPDTISAPLISAPPVESLDEPSGQAVPLAHTGQPGLRQPSGLGALSPEQRAALQERLPASVSLEDVDRLVAKLQSGDMSEVEGYLRHLLVLLAYATLALIILSLPVALLAKRWRRSFWGWFVLSLTISPILSFGILLIRGRAPVPPNPLKEREALAKRKDVSRETS
jgi:hypothetical protein